jgi:DNA-binding NtrC family response regulator
LIQDEPEVPPRPGLHALDWVDVLVVIDDSPSARDHLPIWRGLLLDAFDTWLRPPCVESTSPTAPDGDYVPVRPDGSCPSGTRRVSDPLADVRLLATGPSTLDAVVSDGAFRPELRDALGAVTIRVPALRDRKVDLPVLVDLFVEEFARRHVRRVSRVSGHAMDLLTHYDWPGNVAELSRAIERAVILTAGPVIHHHHLPDPVQKAGGSLAVPPVGLGEALDAYEKDLLEDALRRAHGVRSAAARMLLTSERILSYRLRKHGIDSRRFR